MSGGEIAAIIGALGTLATGIIAAAVKLAAYIQDRGELSSDLKAANTLITALTIERNEIKVAREECQKERDELRITVAVSKATATKAVES